MRTLCEALVPVEDLGQGPKTVTFPVVELQEKVHRLSVSVAPEQIDGYVKLQSYTGLGVCEVRVAGFSL